MLYCIGRRGTIGSRGLVVWLRRAVLHWEGCGLGNEYSVVDWRARGCGFMMLYNIQTTHLTIFFQIIP